MKTIQEVHQALTTASPVTDVRRHDDMQIGQVSHQGDVYVHKIDCVPPCWNNDNTAGSRQVAVGNTTGSRHVASGPVRVLWPTSQEQALKECPIKNFSHMLGRAAAQCLGPIVIADGDWTLTHPEHAHHKMPAGVYLVTYQLDRLTMRIVAD